MFWFFIITMIILVVIIFATKFSFCIKHFTIKKYNILYIWIKRKIVKCSIDEQCSLYQNGKCKYINDCRYTEKYDTYDSICINYDGKGYTIYPKKNIINIIQYRRSFNKDDSWDYDINIIDGKDRIPKFIYNRLIYYAIKNYGI